MKKFVTLVLALAMLVSMFTLPAVAADEILLRADYDTYDAVFINANQYGAGKKVENDALFGSNAASWHSWSNTPIGAHSFTKQTEGLLDISFDFYVTDLNKKRYFVLNDWETVKKDTTSSAKDLHEYLNLLKIGTDGSATLVEDADTVTPKIAPAGSIVARTVYSYTCQVDLTNKTITTDLRNKATGTRVGNYVKTEALYPSTRELGDWPKTSTGFDRFGVYTYEDGYHVYTDNLLIKKTTEPMVDNIPAATPDPSVILSANYETAETSPAFNNTTYGKGEVVANDAILGGNVSKWHSWSYPPVGSHSFTRQTNGVIDISFDFYVTTLNKKIYFTLSDWAVVQKPSSSDATDLNEYLNLLKIGTDGSATLLEDDDSVAPKLATAGSVAVNTAYSYSARLDLTNKSIKAVLKNRSNSAVVGEEVTITEIPASVRKLGDWPETSTGFDRIGVFSYQNGWPVFMDNILIKSVTEETPGGTFETSVTYGNNKLTFSYTNGTGAAVTPLILVANYKANGEMVNVDIITNESFATAATETTKEVVYTKSVDSNVTKSVVLMWDSFTSLRPLMDATQI